MKRRDPSVCPPRGSAPLSSVGTPAGAASRFIVTEFFPFRWSDAGIGSGQLGLSQPKPMSSTSESRPSLGRRERETARWSCRCKAEVRGGLKLTHDPGIHLTRAMASPARRNGNPRARCWPRDDAKRERPRSLPLRYPRWKGGGSSPGRSGPGDEPTGTMLRVVVETPTLCLRDQEAMGKGPNPRCRSERDRRIRPG